MKRQESIDGYLYALDGFRALSVILIFIFHNWQQSWIGYSIRLTQNTTISLELFQRYGYIAIDVFFVLSGFCLFYPVARAMFGECKQQTWKQFFIKRARRILPAYYIMLILLFIFPVLSYATDANMPIGTLLRHFLTHATFTHNLFPDTLVSTISTAWTMSVECQFYLLFPLLVLAFKRKPVLSYLGCVIFGIIFRICAIVNTDMSMYVQGGTLYYLDVFATGMITSYFVVFARHKLKNIDKLSYLMTAVAVVSMFCVYGFMKWMDALAFPNGFDAPTYFRFLYRPVLYIILGIMIFSSCYSVKLWQKNILGNKFFMFISTISYSFYLWHQNIHIFLRRMNIPYTTVNPPMDDRAAMEGFVVLSVVLSVAVACLSTFLIERPVVKYGFKGCIDRIHAVFSGKKDKVNVR